MRDQRRVIHCYGDGMLYTLCGITIKTLLTMLGNTVA